MNTSLPPTPTKLPVLQRTPQQEQLHSSPDPLRMGFSSPLTPLTSQATPKKRKVMEVLIDTPSKRPHKFELPPSSPSRTPQTSTSSSLRKGSSGSNAFVPPKMEVFVEITPTRNPFSTPSQSRTHSDLGGYGQEGDDDYMRRMSIKSSAKRTGERDDRGS